MRLEARRGWAALSSSLLVLVLLVTSCTPAYVMPTDLDRSPCTQACRNDYDDCESARSSSTLLMAPWIVTAAAAAAAGVVLAVVALVAGGGGSGCSGGGCGNGPDLKARPYCGQALTLCVQRCDP
ncbi:MAG: hypothetical protein P1V51_09530 [Deltaproteobacteria bacterium]|nr:hypothetical protein [Deltaproteobacteria bacterium]